jgi:hypothetical protein
MENYAWISHIWNLNFQTILDEKMTKTKFVDLVKLCNFVVHGLFIWNHLCMVNYAWISHIWNLNFPNDLGCRNDKTKVVDVDFVVENFFIWIHLRSQILIPNPDQDRIRRTNIPFRHKCYMGTMVRGGMREATSRGFEPQQPWRARKIVGQAFFCYFSRPNLWFLGNDL